MKRITLQNIYTCLRDLGNEVRVPDDTIVRARLALQRMLAVGRGEKV
nr:quinolinate synthase NadA [Arenimonas daejeonensis]